MEVRLTPEQEALISRIVADGRYESPEAAVVHAFGLLAEYERRREELRALIAEGEADLEAGRYTDYDEETSKTLADELISEARALRDAGQL